MMRAISLLSGACAASLAVGFAGSVATAALSVPSGFEMLTVASVPQARELAVLPDGDLVVGTKSRNVYIVPNAEAVTPGKATVFATLPDELAAGVAYSPHHREIYVATSQAVYATSYVPGDHVAGDFRKIARVRAGPIAPNSDGDVHSTTSVAVLDADDTLYVGVGSSCNACVEADSTRAS
ncbi:MAG: hypothetical protein JOY69_09130, partial [Candidatus Eremiobacteraeota bacterium]|nr:hypothetical protein [Candidatus Eremiobacteraeota bacterium]